MRKRTIADYQQSEWVDYSANGIILFNKIQQVAPPEKEPLIIDVYIVMVCLQGTMLITINNNPLKLTRNQILIVQPNSVVTNYNFSKTFVSRTLVFSQATITNDIFLSRKVWDNISYLQMHPVLSLSADGVRLFKNYYKIATNNLSTADNVYKQEIINNWLRCVIYELLMFTDRLLREEMVSLDDRKQKSNDDLYRRFRELLAFSRGRIRKVEQFASQLFVTPDQLTAAIKDVSGRTSLEWITESTVKSIKYELIYTQKTIKEICKELNFPSLSFFGRYFKQHTGFSPRDFRKQLDKGFSEQ